MREARQSKDRSLKSNGNGEIGECHVRLLVEPGVVNVRLALVVHKEEAERQPSDSGKGPAENL